MSVYVNETIAKTGTSIYIIDMNGNVVTTQKLTGNSNVQLQLENIKSGTYIVAVAGKKQRILATTMFTKN